MSPGVLEETGHGDRRRTFRFIDYVTDNLVEPDHRRRSSSAVRVLLSSYIHYDSYTSLSSLVRVRLRSITDDPCYG